MQKGHVSFDAHRSAVLPADGLQAVAVMRVRKMLVVAAAVFLLGVAVGWAVLSLSLGWFWFPVGLAALLVGAGAVFYEYVRIRRFVMAPLLVLLVCSTAVMATLQFALASVAGAALCKNGPYGGADDPCDEEHLEEHDRRNTATVTDRGLMAISLFLLSAGFAALLLPLPRQSSRATNPVGVGS
ncbi:MAG: hypothetical protein K1X64_21050 [Myxococcaceae bacterium]|nr:hypothetical protein [Myxococcaceae bacterium]